MILVTGARGHIGNVLVRLLYEKGHKDMRLMVHSGDVSFIEPYAKEIVRCDICDADAVEEAVRGCTDVFHLAGFIHMTGSEKQQLYDINVTGVKNIVRACTACGVRRLVHVSSIHALSPDDSRTIHESVEADLKRCGDEYSRTKLLGTMEVIKACETSGLDAVVVYPTGVIGPYDYRSSMTGIMFKKYISASGPQLCFEGRFDFVDVRDVAEGIYLAWQRGRKGQGYILSGSQCSIPEMIEMIGKCKGQSLKTLRVPTFAVKACAMVMPVYYTLTKKTPVITRETVDVMVSGVQISNEKARNELGFSPRPLEQTLRDTVKWHEEADKPTGAFV